MARVRVQVPGGNFKSIQVAQSTSGGQDPGSGSAQNPLTPAQQVAVANIVQAYSNSVAIQQQAAAASVIQSVAALAAGSTTQIQYNNAGAFGASANLVWNYTDNYLAIANATNAAGAIQVAATSGDSVFGLAVSAGSGESAAISLAGNGNTYDDTDFKLFQSPSSVATLYNGADAAMEFYTDAALALTINADGGLVIAQPSSADYYGLEVSGPNNNWTGVFLGGSTTGESYGIIIQAGTDSSDYCLQANNQSDTEYLAVRGDGLTFVKYGLSRPITTTITSTTYTMLVTDTYLIFNVTSSCTLTLLAASSYPGRELLIKTISAETVVSASSNVLPQTSASAGTAILAATAGAWAYLVSNGTDWVIMASGT